MKRTNSLIMIAAVLGGSPSLHADLPPVSGDLFWFGPTPVGNTGIVNPRSGTWSVPPAGSDNWLQVLVDSGTTGAPVSWLNSLNQVANFAGNGISEDAAVEALVTVSGPIQSRRLVFDNQTFTGINHNGDLIDVFTTPQRLRFTNLPGGSLEFGRGRVEAIYDSYTFATGPDVFSVHIDNRYSGGTKAQRTPVVEMPITGTLAPSQQDIDEALFGGTPGNLFGGLGIRGSVELAGANTFTGGVNVINGTLTIRDDANLGAASGDVRLFRGSVLAARFVENNGLTQRLTLNSGRDLVAFPLPSFGGSGSGGGGGGISLGLQVDTHILRVDGRILGPGVNKTGTGTLEIANGANDFDNLWVREGAVEILSGANGGRTVTLGDYTPSFSEPRLTYREGTHTITALNSIQNQGNLELHDATLRVEAASSLFGGSTFGGKLSGTGTLVIAGANNHVTLGRNVDVVGGLADHVGNDAEVVLTLAGIPEGTYQRDVLRPGFTEGPSVAIESGTLNLTSREAAGSELVLRGGVVEATRNLSLFKSDVTFATSYGGTVTVPLAYDEGMRTRLIVDGHGVLRGTQPMEFVLAQYLTSLRKGQSFAGMADYVFRQDTMVLREGSSLTLDFSDGGRLVTSSKLILNNLPENVLDEDSDRRFRSGRIGIEPGNAAIIGAGSVDHTDLIVRMAAGATLRLEERSSQLAIATAIVGDISSPRSGGLDAGFDIAGGSDVSIERVGIGQPEPLQHDPDARYWYLPGVTSGSASLTKSGSGTLRFNGHAPDVAWIVTGGTLGGTGTFGDVTLLEGAGFDLGNSPGTAMIDGDFTMLPGSYLLMEIASSVLFDQLFVDGTLTLDGLVTIRFLDGYVPEASLMFPLLDATNLLGSFSEIRFEGLPEGVSLQASNFVTVIPEPSTYAALIGTAVLALATVRRGRRSRL